MAMTLDAFKEMVADDRVLLAAGRRTQDMRRETLREAAFLIPDASTSLSRARKAEIRSRVLGRVTADGFNDTSISAIVEAVSSEGRARSSSR